MDSQALVEKDNNVFSDLSKLNMKESKCDMVFKEHLADISSSKGKEEQTMSEPLILSRSSDGSYCCPACNKNFASRSATIRHYRNHTGKHPYSCSFCYKKFASKASVDSHQLRVHNFNTDSALSCSECGKLFVRRSALEVHVKIHSSDKSFHCEQCGKSFTQKVTRDIHMAKHTGKYDYHCSICEKSFASQAKLNSHSFVHETPRFTCELCGHRFVRRDTLTVHQRTHTGDHQFQCSMCSRTFLSQSRLITHSQIHHEVPQFQCNGCNSQFKQKSGLMAHMRRLHNVRKPSSRSSSHPPHKEATHTLPEIFTSRNDQLTVPVVTEQPGHTDYNSAALTQQHKCFLCPHCGKEFCEMESLKLHERMHNMSQSTKPVVHACHLCAKSFVQMSKLTAHIHTHLKEPPYQCNVCRKRFHRKDVYNNHIFLHTNERPFSCAHCGKAFASKFNLRVHLNTHSASSRTNQLIVELQCNDCGKKFKHKKTFALHRKTHLGDFAFTCVTCGKKFMKKSHFEGHLRSHASDRPFQCQTCGRRFKERKHCREHVRKAHPSTFSLASLFASITNEDAQMDHMPDILCPTATSSVQEQEDSSVLNVPGLPDQLQPTLSEVSETIPTPGLDTGYLLASHVNLNETSITIPTPMPNLVFTSLEPMLEEIEIPSTTDYLLPASQTALEKNTSCQLEMSQNTISLTTLSGEDTSSVLTLET